MKLLSATSIYQYTEMLGSSKLGISIKYLIDEKRGAKFIDESQLEDVFYKMRHKSFNFKAKFGVIDLFRKGIIRLVYNDNVKLTTAVPFFAYQMQGGGLGVIINITNYAHIEKDGTVKIDPLVLYSMMLGAAYSLNANAEAPILASNGLPELYGDMFVSVIARMANIDMGRRERLKYISTKFFYIQLGLDEVRASAAARKSVKYIDEYNLNQIDMAFPVKAFEDLSTLTETMRVKLTEMNGISFGMLFDRWIKAYGEGAGFACEYVPFFIFQFICMITSCVGVVNTKAMEREANKDSKRCTVLFDRIENSVQALSQR